MVENVFLLKNKISNAASLFFAVVTVNTEQRDRSLTVMIPRAKYRSSPQSIQPTHKHAIKSTFSVEEHKLIDYLEGGIHPGIRKPTPVINNDCKEADIRVKKTPISPTGALVSAGFQVRRIHALKNVNLVF